MKFENTQVWGFEHALRGMRNPKDSWHLSDSKDCYTEYMEEGACCFCDDPLYENKVKCSGVGKAGNYYAIGPKDMKLAKALIHGGPEHRKFLRQIFVSVDITAPLYWWKEFDTYKVGTTANSCSTMHKITSKPITLESFEIDDLIVWNKADNLCKYYSNDDNYAEMMSLIDWLENLRLSYLEWKEKEKNAQDKEEQERCEHNAYLVWKELIRWLPEGWLQKRTVTMTYENLHAICSKSQRYFHKLNEWSGRRNSKLENFIEWVREEIPYAEDFILYHEIEDEIKKRNENVEYAKTFLSGCVPIIIFVGRNNNTSIEHHIIPPKQIEFDIWLEAMMEVIDKNIIDKEKENLFMVMEDNELVIGYKKK